MLLITATDALASVEAIDAAYSSLRQDHWTTLDHRAAPSEKGEERLEAVAGASR